MNNISTCFGKKCVMHSTLFFILFLSFQFSIAQNLAINTDGSKANPNAIVDIKSTTKGLLIPRMTTSQRLLIPQTTGLLVYDTETKSFWYSNGEKWQSINTPVSGGEPWVTTGNVGLSDNTSFIGTTDFVPFNV